MGTEPGSECDHPTNRRTSRPSAVWARFPARRPKPTRSESPARLALRGMVVAGLRFDTSAVGESLTSGSGPRWRSTPRPMDGYNARYALGAYGS